MNDWFWFKLEVVVSYVLAVIAGCVFGVVATLVCQWFFR